MDEVGDKDRCALCSSLKAKKLACLQLTHKCDFEGDFSRASQSCCICLSSKEQETKFSTMDEVGDKDRCALCSFL